MCVNGTIYLFEFILRRRSYIGAGVIGDCLAKSISLKSLLLLCHQSRV